MINSRTFRLIRNYKLRLTKSGNFSIILAPVTKEERQMPNPYIRCNDPSRTLVQHELPEIKSIFYRALWTNDIDKINEVDYELSHRDSSRSKNFRAEVQSVFDLF